MQDNKFIVNQSGISESQVDAVLTLSKEGATIPFIARYRKEQTNNLDEVQIETILRFKQIYDQILIRKTSILKSISEQDALSSELENKIKSCYDLVKLEDYFLPYKKKRTTKTEKAKQAGLEGLAKIIMKQDNGDPVQSAHHFLSESYNTPKLAIEGSLLIVADWISENEIVRDKLRDSFYNHGIVHSKKIKSSIDEANKYKDFYDFSQSIKSCPSYRWLAILRGENEKILNVKVVPNVDYAIQWLERFFIKQDNQKSDLVKIAIQDAFKRLLKPQLETQTRNFYKDKADDKSIQIFTKNLKKLLLAPPVGEKNILAIDPGFRTGCKVVCLDKNGMLLHNETIYPHAPKNEKSKASSKIHQLVELYKIEVIAIGDGTAGRESEHWIKHIRFNQDLKVFVVREDGASIYSASKIAREEFPNYDVTVRGAVSIGRRLSDPLAELVKIDPQALGVGQYQHDVNQNKLKHALSFVVESAVNQVGVNLNTASKHLLAYVSGIGEKTAESIVEYRSKNGGFRSRLDLNKVPRLGDKAFEQSAGFLRIKGGEFPLDNSGVHPEQYKIVKQIAKHYKLSISDLIGNKTVLDQVIKDNDLKEKVGAFTLSDLVKELHKPGLDPRQQVKALEFTPGLKTIQDLKVGMEVTGIVTNVTDFGAFVNIGIKQNGLIHKTQLSNSFVESPTDFISIDEHVVAKVIQVDIDRNRIGLSLK